jgi:hypothetical protein
MGTLSVTEPSSLKDINDKPVSSHVSEKPSSLSVLVAKEAQLFFWNGQEENFEPEGDVTAKIMQRKGSNFEYWLTASNDGGQTLGHKIMSEMNQRWSSKMQSLTWNHLSDNGVQSSWVFRFLDEESYAQFQGAFTQALWESLHQTSWSKMKVSPVGSTSLLSRKLNA